MTSWRFSIAIHKRSKNQVNTASYKHSLDPSKQDSHQESICTPTPFLTGYVMDASAPHDSLHHSAKKSPIKIYGKVKAIGICRCPPCLTYVPHAIHLTATVAKFPKFLLSECARPRRWSNPLLGLTSCFVYACLLSPYCPRPLLM